MKRKCYLYNFPSLAKSSRVREPSILYLVPDKKDWDSEYVFGNETKKDGDLYLCSVLTCGFRDFVKFAGNIPKEKIIAGGYHAGLCPEAFLPYASKVVTGFGENIDEIIKSGRTGIIAGEFRHNHMERGIFPLDRLVDGDHADIFPGQLTLSVNSSAGCMFPCDMAASCPTKAVYGEEKYFYPLRYFREELKLIRPYPWNNLCVRDEGFFAHPEFKEIVKLLGGTGRRFYHYGGMFSPIGEDTVKLLRDNNCFYLSLSLNLRNPRTDQVPMRLVELLHKHRINIHLIVFAEPQGGKREPAAYFGGVLRHLYAYMPASVEILLLRDFRETGATALGLRVPYRYKALKNTTGKDPDDYAAPGDAWRTGKMADLQLKYYLSKAYAGMRKFDCGDNLSRQFLKGRNGTGFTGGR